jgi:NAD(P)-dependent dehydrogenase (short-subunit alcohol dehydrogenase family)
MSPGQTLLAIDALVVDTVFGQCWDTDAKGAGKIDVLFVNAGISKFTPLAETSESTYDEHFDINIKGAYLTIQKALPVLNDETSIILNTSAADSKGHPGTSVYAATKAALRSLARTAAAELAGRGIRVNTVAPGPTVTPLSGRNGTTSGSCRRIRQANDRDDTHEAVRAAGGGCQRCSLSCVPGCFGHHRR